MNDGDRAVWEFIDQPIKHYSSGMYLRLAFSVAVHTTPDILLIDEILAVGDSSFQAKCFAKMEEFKKAGLSSLVIAVAGIIFPLVLGTLGAYMFFDKMIHLLT